MKKLFILIVVLSAFTFSSCKRCRTCEVSVLGITVQDPKGEQCGSKKELDDYEATFKAENECDDPFFVSFGGTCECKK